MMGEGMEGWRDGKADDELFASSKQADGGEGVLRVRYTSPVRSEDSR